MTRMGTTAQVNQWKKELKAAGCKILHDKDAGLVKVIDNGIEILWAMRKGSSNIWIMRFKNSDTFVWNDR